MFSFYVLEIIEDHLVLFAECPYLLPPPHFSDIVDQEVYWLHWSLIHDGPTLELTNSHWMCVSIQSHLNSFRSLI